MSHLHALSAPKQDKANSFQELDQFGFISNFIRQLRKQRRQQAAPLDDLCIKAAELKVEDFMHASAEHEFIDHEATQDMAIHQMA